VTCAVALIGWPNVAEAGAWTTEEGVVWSKIALFHLDSDRIFVDSIRAGTFCGDRTLDLGERAPYDCQLEGGGGLITTQLFLEAAIGLHERVDLRLQVPIVLQGRFDSSFVGENEQGLGDIRFGGQVLLLSDPIVLSAGWEVKAPTGEFVTDAVRIPLGEGQWDLAFRGLIARSVDWQKNHRVTKRPAPGLHPQTRAASTAPAQRPVWRMRPCLQS